MTLLPGAGIRFSRNYGISIIKTTLSCAKLIAIFDYEKLRILH